MYKLLIIMAVAAVTASLDLISILTFSGYVLQADAKGVAFVAVAMFFPLSVLGKFYAKLAAKYQAKHLMVISLIVRAAATSTMFFAYDLPTLVVLVAVRSSAIGLFYPTIAGLAERYKEHGKFAAWTNLTNSAARVIAPLVGGVLGVLIGEKIVFVVSAVMCVLVLPLIFMGLFSQVDKTSSDAKTKTNPPFAQIGLNIWLLMGVPIIGVSGLSVMMSNLLPYTMNLFEIPKIILSVSLSASAVTALLCNIVFVRLGTKRERFPTLLVAGSWFGTCVGFLGLCVALPSSHAALLLPMLFVVLTLCKTTFTVAVMGFVFQQPKAMATGLAAFDQSLSSFAGMATTLVAAFSLTSASPLPMMYVTAGLGMGACLVWWLRMRWADKHRFAAARG